MRTEMNATVDVVVALPRVSLVVDDDDDDDLRAREIDRRFSLRAPIQGWLLLTTPKIPRGLEQIRRFQVISEIFSRL